MRERAREIGVSGLGVRDRHAITSFSIIVPTRNRSGQLGRTLKQLVDATRNGPAHEIIVVDNGSSDATAETVHAAIARSPRRSIRYVCEPVPGLLAGRHRGALEAQGAVCVFLDDDVRVGARWLESLDEMMQDEGVVLAGGPSFPLFETAAPRWLEEFYVDTDEGRLCTWLSLFDGGDSPRDIDALYVMGLNFAIRRDVLFSLQGFHPDNVPKGLQRFQGDGETGLALKVRASGMRSRYHPGASVEHEVPASRLTAEYFEARAFYQGVCDSYASIRYGTEPEKAHAVTAPSRPVSWLDALRHVKHGVVRIAKRNQKRVAALVSGARRIERAAIRGYSAGFAFHQREVAGDDVLREWVLRPDYWDYAFPNSKTRTETTMTRQS